MKNIFTEQAWEKMKTQGYYKPGITLSTETVNALRKVLDTPQASGKPWTEFLFAADDKAGGGPYDYNPNETTFDKIRRFKNSISKKILSAKIHQQFTKYRYKQSIYSSSDLLPKVLKEMFEKGFADHLSDNHLLVSHDIYFENTDQQLGFGFHEDGWSLELLYNTDDDVSIYISLQEHNENTGGRLHVDPDFTKSERFKYRNHALAEFSEICQNLGCVDKDGYVVREKVVKSRAAMKEFRRLRYQRAMMPAPKKEDMISTDSVPGEVILFPNLFYHAGEQWKPGNEGSKGLYFMAFMPIYKLNIRPPSSFLNGEPCSRFILDPANAQVIPIDPNINPIPEYAIDLPV